MIRILQGLIFGTVFSKEAVSTSATATSSSVDTLEKGDSLFLLVATTISGGAAGWKIQESSDDSTWTDVAGAAAVAIPGDTDDGKLYGILVTRDKTNHKRYLRQSYTHSGSGSAVLEGIVVHDNGQEFPENASQAGFDGGLLIS